jgi:hypothetical protein
MPTAVAVTDKTKEIQTWTTQALLWVGVLRLLALYFGVDMGILGNWDKIWELRAVHLARNRLDDTEMMTKWNFFAHWSLTKQRLKHRLKMRMK